MDAADIIRRGREHAGLTQRELAALAHTSAAAICKYENGDRVPRVDTLQRIVEASGAAVTITVGFDGVTPTDGPIDVRTNGRALEQVLGLADELPRRTRDRSLTYPILRDAAR